MVDTDDTRQAKDKRQQTTPGVWHKLPTGELNKGIFLIKHSTQCIRLNIILL